ncbi:recombinase family protein [Enterococcus sp. BWM-S5]|uniref:Recombinase family protein n=1 Tax=Enterococcus larvae TaxID=2794352 RepID=A0ABS4CIE0_9ENTE|nr:recombinase family protein [Enterococcus larvae]MBP1046205.1 recombinase family protein [Enterococcus larvae]
MNNRTLTIKDYTQVDLAQVEEITVVYCRLSKDDKNLNESDSIANQKKILREVVEKEQLVNPIYFVDDGITGTSLSYRPAISRAVELVEAGKVNNFIVKDLSRLARNYLDSGKLIEITFPENDVRFIAVSDGFDSSKQSDNDANLLPLRNLFNEWYARDTSKKIRAVKEAKAKAGERMTSNVIYGYKRDPENPKNWMIDPVGAEIVQRIFSEVKTGKSFSKIARELEQDCVETPSRRRLSLGEHPPALSLGLYNWHRTMVEDIIGKMEYLGHTVNGRTRRKSFKDKTIIQLPKEEWLIFEHTHEAIIDQDTFDIVQKMRQHKRVLGSPRFEVGHENLFAGLVFCGTCGSKHYYCAFEKNGQNLDHYKCSKYSRTIDRCENAHYIRKADLEEIVLAELNQLLKVINFDEPTFLKKLEKKFQLESSKATNRQRQKLLADERRYEEIDRIIQRLYEDSLSGKLTDGRFMKMSQTYEEEQTQLIDAISVAKETLSTQENQSLDVSRFMDRVKKYTQQEALSVEIVNELIDKIIIHKPEGTKRNRILTIDIHYNFIGDLKD